jgi:hypothetical protein
MSNYTIEVTENVVNLDVLKDHDVIIEIKSSDNFITFDTPSGYPILFTSGTLPVSRVGSGYLIENLTSGNTIVRTFGDQVVSGSKIFNGDIISSGNSSFKFQPTSLAPSYFPVLISDPSTFSRQVYTRTSSQVKSDFGLNNVQNIALSGLNFSAGSGLVGGGDLSASRSFDIGAGDGISVGADSISVDSTVVRANNIDQSISGIKSFINTSGTRFTTGGSSSKDIILRPVSGVTSNNSITISPHTNIVSNRTYHLPEAGADADFVMTAGSQIITGSKAFTSSIIFNSGTFNSLRVGATPVALSGHTHTSFAYLNIGSPNITNYLTIQVPGGYAAGVYQDNAFFQIINNDSGDTVFGVDGYGRIIFGTIDAYNVNGLNDAISLQIPTSIVYTSGNQSISGVKTFTNNINVSGLITANSGNFTNSLNVNGTSVSISGHTHTSSNITDFNSSVSGLLPITLLTAGSGIGISGVGSNYTISTTGTFGLTQTQVDSRVNTLTSGIYAPLTGAVFTGIISGPSGSFTSLKVSNVDVSVSGHTHNISDITSLQTTLDNKQPSGNYALSSHNHISSNITDFNTSVSGLVNGIYAPLSSPSLTGTPLTPTANAGTNNTQIASTAFVRTEISNLVASAPTALDTLNELATALGNDANFSTTVTNNLAGKANLSGATFTGSISGPSGNFTSLKVNNVDVSANGHTHTSSDITNFNSAVSGLLPTIANSGDNRLLTSTGSTVGINAESNLTFNGSLLAVSGNLVANTGTINSLNFNNIGDPDLSIRQLAWNNSEGSLAVGLSDTYEMFLGGELHYRVRNNTGSSILAGTAVYATGLTPGGNNRIEIAPKAADGSIREVRFMGLVTENIDNGVNGFTTHFGYIRNIDTRGDYAANGATNKVWASGEPVWAEGDILYIHPTAEGKLTKIEPKHSISVAIILNRHQNQGKLFVRPTSYGHLGDNHDVDVSGATNGQFLQYNSTTDYWVPSSSGNFTSLSVNSTGVSISGHTHSSSNITDFNSSVSGLLPVGTANYLSKFGTGGSGLSNSLIYDNGTNVGIGTTSPSYQLDVTGSGRFLSGSNSIIIDPSGRSINASTTDIFLKANNKTIFRGLDANAWSDNVNTTYFQVGTFNANCAFASQSANPFTRLGFSASNFHFTPNYINTVAAPTAMFQIDGASTTGNLVVTSAGSVGVGTTTPSKKLDVIGDARVSGVLNLVNASDSTDRSIAVTSNNMTFAGVHGIFEYSVGLRGSRGSACGLESNATNGYLALAAGGSEKVRIATDGKVGIGTTTPSGQLHVVGTGLFTNIDINGSVLVGSASLTVNGGILTQGAFVRTSIFSLYGDNNTKIYKPDGSTLGYSVSSSSYKHSFGYDLTGNHNSWATISSSGLTIGSSTLSSSNLPSIINNTNLYLWSNFN